MPKKRKTRTAQTRNQPKVPDGDEGANLEIDLKTEKLKTLLEDYDTQIRSFMKEIKEDLRDFEKGIECAFMVEITKIPKFIRDMDLDEYLKSGGQLASTDIDKMTENIALDIDIDMSALSTLTKSKKKKKTKNSAMDNAEQDSGTVKKAPTSRTRKKALSNATNLMPPPSTARTRPIRQRGQFETPAQRGGPSMAGWETPLITPKFDPRLPVTPDRVRKPKQDEVFLSLAGSPISVEALSAGKKGGKGSQLTNVLDDILEKSLDDIQVPDYTHATKEMLKHLKAKLNAIPLSPNQAK